MKRRILRLGLTVLFLVLFVGYFLFQTLFFSPFEGQYGYPLSTLIPREIDFYLAKSDLQDDFDPFPRPAIADEFLDSEAGQAVQALPAYVELLASLDVEASLAQLDEALAQLPVQVDPLRVFGGRELAVAGRLGAGPGATEWAAYGRTGWMGKLGVALLDYPDLLGLADQGIQVAEEGVGVSIRGGQLPRPLFLHRIRDVVVVATSAEFTAKASQLEAVRGEDSFGLSAKYGDHVALAKKDDEDLEFYVDYRTLAEVRGLPGRWPDPASSNLLTALFARLFQAGSVRELLGTTAFGNGVTLRATGLLSSETMNAVQKRLYRARGTERERIVGDRQIASLVPSDAGLFLYVNASLGDLLRETVAAADRDLVSNLEDLVLEVWGYTDLSPLIDDLSTAFKSRFAFALRNHDYPDEGAEGPPHNDLPVPAWALVLEVAERSKIEEVRSRIHAQPESLGISGREPGSVGVFVNRVQGGHRVYEYWSQLIDGTGHLATLELEDYFIVSNDHRMLGAMVQTLYDGAPNHPRLSDDSWFQTQVVAGLPANDVLLWLNPAAIHDTTRAMARRQADDALVIDWSVERPRIERKILKERFPDESWGSLSPAVEEQLAVLYETEASEFERQFRSQHAPALRRRYETRLDALESMRAVLVGLSIDPKAFELFVRLVVPLE